MQQASPFAPGESPFRVKGGIYLGTLKYFEKEVPGGVAALHAQIEDGKLRAFIEQKFLPSGWYDVLPVAQLIRAEARALNLTVANYLRKRTVFQVEQDIGGIYRFLLAILSPESVATRLPRLLTQIFDHGTTEVRLVEPGWLESTMGGFPALLYDWYSTAFEVYTETALHKAGGKKILALVRPPEPEGQKDGVDLIKFRVDARWEP
jgi:hypothetical protein